MSTNPPANDPSVVLPSEATIVERPISPLTVPVEVAPPPEATIAEPPNKSSSGIPVAPVVRNESKTQLQQLTANLIHIHTNTQIELPRHLTVVHIGKPNDRIPPDIDVSGFANSDIVSRIHADIRLEGESIILKTWVALMEPILIIYPYPLAIAIACVLAIAFRSVRETWWYSFFSLLKVPYST
jgi:hypothetical protein